MEISQKNKPFCGWKAKQGKCEAFKLKATQLALQ